MMHPLLMLAHLVRLRWSAEKIRHEQSRMLCKIVAHAHARVPFYRALYDSAGIRPDEIRGLDDLHRLPVVQRLDYRRAPEQERLSDDADTSTTVKLKTSGSTGVPLVIHFSRGEQRYFASAWDCARMRWGFWPWRTRLSIGVNRRRMKSPLHDVVEVNGDHSIAFNKHHDILVGYPSLLFLIAQEARRSGRTIRPRIVYSGGETLLPSVRAYLEETFGVPVLDFYGAIEFGIVLEPCPAGNGLRAMGPGWIIEILRSDGTAAAPGETGELVITSLFGRTMPFIRYAIGDLAVAGVASCACGSAHTHVAQVLGRGTDFVYHADGTALSPMTISIPFYERTDILQYRVTQCAQHAFRIEIISPDGVDFDRLAADVRAYYASRFGANEIEIVRTEQILPEPSGKMRRFIPLNPQFQPLEKCAP